MKRIKLLCALISTIFLISTNANTTTLRIGAGVNFLMPHTEKIQAFSDQLLAGRRATYHPGLLLDISGQWLWEHAILELNYYYLYNSLNIANKTENVTASSMTKGFTSSHNIVVNGIYRFYPHHYLSPYLGLGAGAAYVHVFQSLGFPFVTAEGIRDSAPSFATNFLFGLSYVLTTHLNLDLRARYLYLFPCVKERFRRQMRLALNNVSFTVALNAKLR